MFGSRVLFLRKNVSKVDLYIVKIICSLNYLCGKISETTWRDEGSNGSVGRIQQSYASIEDVPLKGGWGLAC